MAAIAALPPALSSPIPSHSDTNTVSQASLEDIATGAVCDDREDAGQIFLLTQMLGILRNLQYNDETLQRVAGRVAANFWWQNVPCSASEEAIRNDLHHKLKDGFARSLINSNEPVLLISIPQEGYTISPLAINPLKQAAIEQLREQGIKPVRVYTRRARDSISLLLLNVVNTDIGGPSMVQLLDAAFHGSDWSHDLLSKEAYHEQELLWHDEHWPFDETRRQTLPQEAEHASSDHPEIDDAVDQSSQGPTMPPPCKTSEQQMDAGIDSNVDQDCHEIEKDQADEKEVDSDASEERVEHPEWTAWRERDAARAPIQHPTWSREYEDTPFLDLIKGQSANVGDDDPLSIISGDRNRREANGSSSENGADDDFVVLEGSDRVE